MVKLAKMSEEDYDEITDLPEDTDINEWDKEIRASEVKGKDCNVKDNEDDDYVEDE